MKSLIAGGAFLAAALCAPAAAGAAGYVPAPEATELSRPAVLETVDGRRYWYGHYRPWRPRHWGYWQPYWAYPYLPRYRNPYYTGPYYSQPYYPQPYYPQPYAYGWAPPRYPYPYPYPYPYRY